MNNNIEITDTIDKSQKRRQSDFDFSTQGSRGWQEGILGLMPLLPSETTVSVWKLGGLLMLMFLLLLVILGRLFQLQVVMGREHYILSEQNKVYTREHYSERGVIYNREGTVVARNEPSFSVGLVYSNISADEIETLRQNLLVTFPEHQEHILTRLENAQKQPYKEILIVKNVSHEQQIMIQVREDDFPGVSIIQDVVRSYPEGELYSAILGYTGAVQSDEIGEYGYDKYINTYYVGKTGFEYQYENYLAGTPSKAILEREATGKLFKELIITDGLSGEDLYLTIDGKMQQELHRVLNEGIDQYNAWGGSAVVMDLRNGEILGMVSLPTYDNNVFSSGDEQKIQSVLSDTASLLVNRAVSGLYAPGSTIKMAVGGYALEKGYISETTRISGKPQVIRVGGWEFPDWTYSWGSPAHGMMDLADAIANSSDIFFYKIGGGFPPECTDSATSCEISGMGVEGLVNALRAFGLGQKTGIDLPAELPGLVPDPNWKLETRGEPWFLGNTYHLSIGQGDLLSTPIQILNLVSIIASDSSTPIPHLIKNEEVVTELGYDLTNDKPISLDSIKVARQGMVQAVESGIVYPLRGSKEPVAAKTGTAEFGELNAEGEYQTHAWVTGFAPVEKPMIGFVFMLEAGGKSSNAAEVAREFIDWYFE